MRFKVTWVDDEGEIREKKGFRTPIDARIWAKRLSEMDCSAVFAYEEKKNK